MLALTAIKTFFVDNIKWVAILAALSVFSVFGYKVYSLIQENATHQATIEQLKSDLALAELKATLARQNYILLNTVVEQRDREVEELTDKLDGLTDNLGPDIKDHIAKSVEEYLIRLKNTAPQ